MSAGYQGLLERGNQGIFFVSFFATLMLIGFIISVLEIVAFWRIFEKAGEPGWAILIPFYNLYVMFRIAFGNGLCFLLIFIPGAAVIVAIILYYKLAVAFGQGVGFTLGLVFVKPVFLMILAFGDYDYYGPM